MSKSQKFPCLLLLTFVMVIFEKFYVLRVIVTKIVLSGF
jgi:hypothetical protein